MQRSCVFYLHAAELPIRFVSAGDHDEMSIFVLMALLLAPPAPENDIVPIGAGVEPPKLAHKI